MFDRIENNILAGRPLSRADANVLAGSRPESLQDLFASAVKVRRRYRGDSIDLCAIINAKSGACPEDCSYCAQSSRSVADVEVYPLVDLDLIREKAAQAADDSVKRFCIVTSGKRVSKADMKRIGEAVGAVRKLGLLPCATLGLLDYDDLVFLRDAGLERYHHNIETSERYFPEICSSHTFADKLRTIEAVRKAGVSLCSGGIFGMGETWDDRLDMAFLLKDLDVDSVPVNYLTPIQGTPMGGMSTLDPLEALKIISVFRFVLPDSNIRVCGGRLQTLGELNPLLFMAGADGLLVGNYLTTAGRSFAHDVDLIRMLGLAIG